MSEAVATGKLLETVTNAALMTVRQEEIVKRDIKVLERALHGQPMQYYGGDHVAGQYVPETGLPSSGTVMVVRDQPVPDREDLEKTLKSCHETLKMGTAPTLSTAAMNQLYAAYQEAVQRYQEGMPSYDQMWRPTWQNVQLHQRHAAANKRRGRFLQNVRRILDPADESFHVEELRPEKPTPYSGLAFRKGYDAVQWSTDKELELRAQELDDATYFQFLTIKAQGITTPRLIQQAMHIDQSLYEACMQRLQQASAEQLPLEESAGEEEGVVELSAAETEACQTYGDAVLALIEEHGSRTSGEVATLLLGLTPEVFPGEGRQRSGAAGLKARLVLRALMRLGHVTEDHKAYRLAATTVEAVESEE